MIAPELTFVIPAFNAAATLSETLASVRGQSLEAWEAIVVDDGSEDETPTIARSAGDARVRLVRQANRGLGAARNRGLHDARAKRVCFLDADDVVAPSYASRMVAGLDGADVVACAHRMVGPSLEDLGWESRPAASDTRLEAMIAVNPFVVGAVVMRTDAPRRLGVDAFDESLPVHEDWDMWLRLTAARARWGTIVDEALFSYRMRPGSMSADLELMWRTGLRVIERVSIDVERRSAGARAWTVRSLARAIARGDAALAGEIARTLGALVDGEVGLLASSLRWALCREDLVAPARVPEAADGWRARITTVLEPALCAKVLARLDLTARDWRSIARRAVEVAGDEMVIYGYGRNGRSLVAALREARPSVRIRIIDDMAPLGVMAGMRIELEQVGPRDTVIVTPDDGAPILARLGPDQAALTLADLSRPVAS